MTSLRCLWEAVCPWASLTRRPALGVSYSFSGFLIRHDSYFVRSGIIQPTYKGRQWRHGVIYWPFMLAGLIGPPDDEDDDDYVASPVAPPRRRRRSSAGSCSTGGSPVRARSCGSREVDNAESPVPNSDNGTDDTNSDADEAAAKGSVGNPLRKTNRAEYKRVFKGKAVHEAVLHVVCSLTRLMGKICGDNTAPGAMRTEAEAAELQREAKMFVTDLVRVLFGAVNTTKMHRLAFHLMQELLLRGNLEEGDTSTNEMLHKLLKAMYRVTNKHPDNFQVQMMRCEQTLLHILTEGADERLREAQRSDAAKRAAVKRRTSRRKHRRPSPGTADDMPVDSSASVDTDADDEAGYAAGDDSDHGTGSNDADDVNFDLDATQDAEDSATDSAYATCTSEEDGRDDTADDDLSVSTFKRQMSPSDCSPNEPRANDSAGLCSPATRYASQHAAPATTSGSTDITSGSSCASEGSSTSGPARSGGSARASTSATASALIDSGRSASSLSSASAATGGAWAPPATSKRGSKGGSKRTGTAVKAGQMPPAKRVRPAAGSSAGFCLLHERARIRGRRVSVAAAAAADGGRLQRLPTLLALHGAQMLTIGNSMSFKASFEWGARGVQQRVRAARALYNGTAWWDHVLFKDPCNPTKNRLGLARLVIRAVDGERRDLVVVQLLEAADARDGCVLTDFGCARHKWEMDPTTGFPALALVPTTNLQRLEHVVPDFEDLCDRLGLYATPATVPDTPQELPLRRFFVNPFFPWTGGCEDDNM